MEAMVFETELGHTALARDGKQVLALSFGHSSERAAIKSLERTLAKRADTAHSALYEVDSVVAGDDELVDRICAYAEGEEVSFDDLQIDSSGLTPFGLQVTKVCRKIGRGETLTYGEVAKRAGRPGAARAVGSVMSKNRVPLIVPCHRVVPACGGLGGFSAPQGVAMKQRLLEMESTTAVLG